MDARRLHPCRRCRCQPRTDEYPLSWDAWVYVVECSAPECDNAEVGDTEEEAAQFWNWANPEPGGNVPARRWSHAFPRDAQAPLWACLGITRARPGNDPGASHGLPNARRTSITHYPAPPPHVIRPPECGY